MRNRGGTRSFWRWVIVAGLLLLAGCGGARGYRGHFDQGSSGYLVDDDASLADELSAKHLDELYAKSGISARDPSLEEELKKWEHQSKFNMPIQMNQQVRAYLTYFSTERKKVISCQLARSTRYLPMIKEIFQEYGLPEDLAYLAMIESGFNPKALSSAGARGLWQFIKPTGQRYGLIINNQVDERLDPEKSTRAAARYLRDLYQQFGSWYLAAASYNCGEGRVQQKLNKSSNKNFWELSANKCLPNETKNYVPQMIAAIIIAKNPQKFGFTDVPYQKPLARDHWEMAAPEKETTAARAEILAGTASVPAPKTGPLSVAQDWSQPPPLASKQGENSGRKPNSTSRQKTRLAQGKGRTQVAQAGNQGDAETYQGSIFGAPAAPGKQKFVKPSVTDTPKKKSPLAAKTGKGKKQSATKLAKKGDTRYSKARGHQQRSSSHGNSKQAKTKAKSKKLVLSRAH